MCRFKSSKSVGTTRPLLPQTRRRIKYQKRCHCPTKNHIRWGVHFPLISLGAPPPYRWIYYKVCGARKVPPWLPSSLRSITALSCKGARTFRKWHGSRSTHQRRRWEVVRRNLFPSRKQVWRSIYHIRMSSLWLSVVWGETPAEN